MLFQSHPDSFDCNFRGGGKHLGSHLGLAFFHRPQKKRPPKRKIEKKRHFKKKIRFRRAPTGPRWARGGGVPLPSLLPPSHTQAATAPSAAAPLEGWFVAGFVAVAAVATVGFVMRSLRPRTSRVSGAITLSRFKHYYMCCQYGVSKMFCFNIINRWW